jgi:lipopolysaccharide heptosyltransferase I
MGAMKQAARILIIRPSALGDVCRTVPVLASLRQAYPAAQIDWVVQDTFAAAVAGHPALDCIIEFPRATFARWWRNPAVAWRAAGWFRGLRDRNYDLVFDCQGLSRSGLIAWASGARRRVGFRSAKELGWLGYNVRHAEPRPDNGLPMHTVDRMLALLRCDGIPPQADMRLYVAEREQRWWSDFRLQDGWADEPYVVLAPTSRWPSKQWPIERWRELIVPLLQRGIERVVIIGSPSERPQIEGIMPTDDTAATRVVDLVGGTSIPQTMAVIAAAHFVIANDSAPLHMAVGLDRPCIGLFGPTDPAAVGPYRRDEAVLRCCGLAPGQSVNFKDPALGDRLMRSISVNHVLERFDQLRERDQAARAAVEVMSDHAPASTLAPAGHGLRRASL